MNDTEDSLLSELDALYARYKQIEHVATWGGSFEREHGARMDLKPIVNKLFDTTLALLHLRASRPEAVDSVPEGNEEQSANQVSEKPRAVQGEWWVENRKHVSRLYFGRHDNWIDMNIVRADFLADIAREHNASLKDDKDSAWLDWLEATKCDVDATPQASEVVEEPEQTEQTLGGKDAG